ncbi:hypothetical protein, partial [Stenotrophomonas maltophilia group sp. RNC7]|uniref:hypothetical protein n=1 Tax=Stenotrophomonas maltophilia group sp. RNC7 TaxID=3071467 RepID=UPI0027E127D7
CDYRNYAVHIHLMLDSPRISNVKAQISLFGVKLLNVPIDEPWGAGIYINEISYYIEEIQTQYSLFDLRILLNSGDEILVTANNLYYTEESNLEDKS